MIAPANGYGESINAPSPKYIIPETAENDEIHLIIVSGGNTDLINDVPADVNLIESIAQTNQMYAKLYWLKVGQGSNIPGATKTWVGSGTRQNSITGFGYSGVNPNEPIYDTATLSTLGSAHTLSLPALTIDMPGAWVVDLLAVKANNALVTSWSIPTDRTLRIATPNIASTVYGTTPIITDRNEVSTSSVVESTGWSPNGAYNGSTRWSVGLRPAGSYNPDIGMRFYLAGPTGERIQLSKRFDLP